MQLSSKILGTTDFGYFKKNFSVEHTNVSNLEDANVILFGEIHKNLIIQIQNCWLLNKLISTDDTVNIEGCDSHALSREDFFLNYSYPIFKQVKIQGWDCKESLQKHKKYHKRTSAWVDWLENTFFEQQLKKLKQEEQKEAINKIASYLSIDEVQQELKKFQEHGFLKNVEELKEISKGIVTLEHLALLAENADRKNIKILFLIAINSMCDILSLWDNIQDKGMNFYHRNLSLVKKISEAQEGKKTFVFAGKNHLIEKKNSDPIQKKSIQILHQALEKTKYVILFPTKNPNNIDLIKKFFHRSPFEKAYDFFRNIFYNMKQVSQNPLPILGVCLFTGVLSQTKVGYLFFSLGLLGLLGLKTIKECCPHAPPPEFFELIHARRKKLLELSHQISDELRLQGLPTD